MILFPNCKINLGLRITSKRTDGYHDIVTVMVPVGWCDVLELVPSESGKTTLSLSGNALCDCPMEKNLVVKALRATERAVGRELPTDIYLRKIVPDGAGLGGGSSDAAFTILGLNELYGLGLGREEMARIAGEIGSDCPFFIYNRPMLATGRGTDLEGVEICTDGIGGIVVAKGPTEAVSTREAYAGVTPRAMAPGEDLPGALLQDFSKWEGAVSNDFEASIFALRPNVKELKDRMLSLGASYVAMSGSGAAVFGLFRNADEAEQAANSLESQGFAVFYSSSTASGASPFGSVK
ncbi:MAG: 4-(cytidine 5'-diphospho)-2-C-methyl-D-erythritol kinase [Muribaculaceae bacterium]|nr:4-(cytidine 5'-diphospho)-2-C-methyl-D-erythritol kinase [Muribaculaceae bacterium]